MAKFKELLTGIDSLGKFPNYPTSKQKLASAMAWQILSIYPYRTKPVEWSKYENLRGVILADEVGGGKTFEALSIISKSYLNNVKNRKKSFRVPGWPLENPPPVAGSKSPTPRPTERV